VTTRPTSRRRLKWRWRLLILGVLVLATAYLSRLWWLPRAGALLHDADPVEAVDAVYVLGGDPPTRPLLAAKLIRTGQAKLVLLPRQKLTAAERDGLYPAEHDLTQRILVARGVPAEQIVIIGEECFGTDDEAATLARYLEAHPDLKVAVITNDFHTNRAWRIFRNAFGERLSQVRFFGAPTDNFGPDDWWHTERGFVIYTTEFIKLGRQMLR
jgi:uncharacterized SAM-binding protein YcdF (DUF218 family)